MFDKPRSHGVLLLIMDAKKAGTTILKILLYFLSGVVVLFVLLSLAIQIPSVQETIVTKATTYLSKKTNTKVSIDHFSLLLSGRISLSGIYLESQRHDTLLYAGNIKVGIDLFDLLHNKINVGLLDINKLYADVHNIPGDSIMNYQFLINAFTDTTKKQVAKPGDNTSQTKISVNKINLNDIHLKYTDVYNHISAAVNLNELNLSCKEIDLDKLYFHIKEINVKGLDAFADIAPSYRADTSTTPTSPKLIVDRIALENINAKYLSRSKPVINAVIGKYDQENAEVDLSINRIRSGDITLNNSKVVLINYPSDIVTSDTSGSTSAAWDVQVSEINFENNYVLMTDSGIQPSGHLNTSCIELANLNFDANTIVYNSSATAVKLNNLSFNYGNNFSLRKLNCDFTMRPDAISARDLNLITSRSNIQADVAMKYSSLPALKDSVGDLLLNAELKGSHISFADILWAQPELIKQPVISNSSNYVSITGNLKGKVKNLYGEKLVVRTGRQTSLTSRFHIKGLPEIKRAYFEFPDLALNTSAYDVRLLAGKELIPENIQLPSSIHARISFKGSLETFSTITKLKTSSGSSDIRLSLTDATNYDAVVSTYKVDLGYILKNSTLGPVTLTTSIKGSGLDTTTMKAAVTLKVEEFFANKYNYKNISADVKIDRQQYEGTVSVKDTNLDIEATGLLNTAKGNELYIIQADVKGADLKQLHFSEDDLRVSIKGEVDLKGNMLNTVNGKAAISQVVLSKEGNKYILDSLLFASINEKGKSQLDVSSSIVNLNYDGSIAVTDITRELNHYVNNYFPISTNDSTPPIANSNFNLTVQLKSHPVIREVFLPSLGAMDIEPIVISFNSSEKKLDVNMHVNKLEYDSTSISNATLSVNSNEGTLNYSFSVKDISNGNLRFNNFLANGSASKGLATVNITATNPKDVKMLVVHATVNKPDDLYHISFNPSEFILANKQWNVLPDNYVAVGTKGFIIHNFQLSSNDQLLSVNSRKEEINQDIILSLRNFSIDEISEIIKKDKKLAGGIINGDLTLKYSEKGYGIAADLKVDHLSINEVAAGTLTLLAASETDNRFKIDAKLMSNENDVNVSGRFSPADSVSNLDFKVDINKFSMLTVESFIPDQISASSGNMSGSFTIKGNTSHPDVNGSLHFSHAEVIPAVLGSKIRINDETVKLNNELLAFDNFTIHDENNAPLQISGTVNNLYDVQEFDLTISSKNFQLLNSTARQNKDYHGRVMIDCRVRITGNSNLPVVSSRIHLKKGSDFTIAIPEKKLSTDKGEDVVLFVDSLKFHPILVRNEEAEKERGDIKGLDITSTIEVDKEAVLRILIDPTSNDSLIVQGEAALNFAIDPSGKTTLTGTYSLYDGSYIATLESIVRKKFIIQPGSIITWNGDPMDANMDITAIYTVRTSPVDLIANQVSGLSDAEKNNYRMRIPFEVLLQLQGELTQPDISFKIQLPPNEKGVLGGQVNAQLNVLNEDESELNKQVFALLVLGRFVQQNPLETESGAGVSTAARTSVSKFITQQLNQLSSKVIKGVDVSFDIQSYEDYSTGNAEGRTEVGVALEKRLFDERLSVQVGGSVDVEGEKSNQNNASDLTGDVTVEYMLTEDGRYRLKGFRHNQYEGMLEGQLVETGAGVLYSRDFNKWKNFLKLTNREKRKLKNETAAPQGE